MQQTNGECRVFRCKCRSSEQRARTPDVSVGSRSTLNFFAWQKRARERPPSPSFPPPFLPVPPQPLQAPPRALLAQGPARTLCAPGDTFAPHPRTFLVLRERRPDCPRVSASTTETQGGSLPCSLDRRSRWGKARVFRLRLNFIIHHNVLLSLNVQMFQLRNVLVSGARTWSGE